MKVRRKEMINGEILRDEIRNLLDAINEQVEPLLSYDGKIPGIEHDILLANLRKLYENLLTLKKLDDSFSPPVMKEEIIVPGKQISHDETKNNHLQEKEKEPSKSRKETIQKPVQPDLFMEEISGFSMKLQMAREQVIQDTIGSNQPKDLKALITINDKFLFLNELFDGNLREYNLFIEKINTFITMKDVLEALDEARRVNLWNTESNAFKKLEKLVEMKFT